MENKLIILLFKNQRQVNTLYKQMLYAKEVLKLKGYAIWDFVSQPYDCFFEGISKEDYKEIQRKAFERLLKIEWFATFINEA